MIKLDPEFDNMWSELSRLNERFDPNHTVESYDELSEEDTVEIDLEAQTVSLHYHYLWVYIRTPYHWNDTEKDLPTTLTVSIADVLEALKIILEQNNNQSEVSVDNLKALLDTYKAEVFGYFKEQAEEKAAQDYSEGGWD